MMISRPVSRQNSNISPGCIYDRHSPIQFINSASGFCPTDSRFHENLQPDRCSYFYSSFFNYYEELRMSRSFGKSINSVKEKIVKIDKINMIDQLSALVVEFKKI